MAVDRQIFESLFQNFFDDSPAKNLVLVKRQISPGNHHRRTNIAIGKEGLLFVFEVEYVCFEEDVSSYHYSQS